jgi:hypothetical protein
VRKAARVRSRRAHVLTPAAPGRALQGRASRQGGANNYRHPGRFGLCCADSKHTAHQNNGNGTPPPTPTPHVAVAAGSWGAADWPWGGGHAGCRFLYPRPQISDMYQGTYAKKQNPKPKPGPRLPAPPVAGCPPALGPLAIPGLPSTGTTGDWRDAQDGLAMTRRR